MTNTPLATAEPVAPQSDVDLECLLRAMRWLQIALILPLVHIVLYWLPWTLADPTGNWLRRVAYLLAVNGVGTWNLVTAIAGFIVFAAIWHAVLATQSIAFKRTRMALLVWAGMWLAWCLFSSANIIASDVSGDYLLEPWVQGRNFELLGIAVVILGLPFGAVFLLTLNRELGHLLISRRRSLAIVLFATLTAASWIACEIYWEATVGADLRRIWRSPANIHIFRAPGWHDRYGYLSLGMQQIPTLFLLGVCLYQLILAKRRIHRRDRYCLACGYDLRGTEHDRCPECGKHVWRGTGTSHDGEETGS
ncbi:MAG: hypothetical protein KAS72_07315 [Phycisphaerales bacterium]|nr:hypothetical protein [Phycisphaerales bacterium]